MAPSKHQIEDQEHQISKKQRLGEHLTNIVTLENKVIEGETISNFEVENIDWEEHLENHRKKLETEAREKQEQLRKKEIKEQSWELFRTCTGYLEEKDKDWEKKEK